MIDELFIPTMVVQDSYENHAKKARLAYEDLVKFRLVVPVLRIGIRDPVLFYPRIRDPGWSKQNLLLAFIQK
jgi:hypothetical protein